MDHLEHRAPKPGEGPAPFDDGISVPDLEGHLYVTVDQLAFALGVVDVAGDEWLLPCCEGATVVVDQYVGPTGVARWLGTNLPVPHTVRLASMTVAVDLYRRRTSAAGYFDLNGYLARLALDPTAPVAALLGPYMLDLGVG